MRNLLLPFGLAFLLVGCNGKSASPEDSGGGDDSAAVGDTGPVAQSDRDGDSIIDVHEGEADVDGDGKPNAEDRDSDGDVIRDVVEAGDEDPFTLPVDTDGDGAADYLDLDSDGNCVPDQVEAIKTDGGAEDSDGDGVRDFQDFDNDNDGIPDVAEIGACDAPTDTDGDLTPDHLDTDSDADGVGDRYEGGVTEYGGDPVDSDGDGIPDFRDTDSDNDGLTDRDESGTSGDATVEPRDTDGDGRYDQQDTDADGDSLADADEILAGTDPWDSDTDGDGYSDGGEVTAGTDPLDPESVIDGIYVEVGERTTVEHNFEFELVLEMGDIGFIIDTTCSMGGTINAMATEFNQIVTDLTSILPDAAYAAAGHDDYAYGSMGSPGTDKPFYLMQQITTDSAAMQAGLSALRTHSGADGPESGTEAVYQAVTGDGYDQNCDGHYDANTDVYPFIASADDPFGGTGGEYYDASTVGGGTGGGLGFREYSLPVVVLATDNYMRDPGSSNSMYNSTPGGCPLDASMDDTVTAFLDAGARFVGVSVNGSTPYPQMVDLATRTNSLADLDGDGEAAEPVVETWSGSSTEFRTTLVNAIQQLVAGVKFSRIDLAVEGDVYGFVTSIDPAYYEDLGVEDTGTLLDFTLTFRGVVASTTEDQLFRLTLNVLGDGTVLVAQKDIIVVVPGRAF